MRLAAEARDPLKDLKPILYPSKAQLDAGVVGEPSQKIGDYAMHRSEHETGRVFSAVKDLGLGTADSNAGATVGDEVCTAAVLRWAFRCSTPPPPPLKHKRENMT